MLLQFHNVSTEVADAILAHYPSIRSLQKAYSEPYSVEEKELLLANLMVRRGIGSLENSRRVGPELSKKIYKLYTSPAVNDVLVHWLHRLFNVLFLCNNFSSIIIYLICPDVQVCNCHYLHQIYTSSVEKSFSSSITNNACVLSLPVPLYYVLRIFQGVPRRTIWLISSLCHCRRYHFIFWKRFLGLFNMGISFKSLRWLLSLVEKQKNVEFLIRTKRYVKIRGRFIVHCGFAGYEKKLRLH